MTIGKKGKSNKESMEPAETVVVAVKASISKGISRTALVWALTHLVKPGDCISLLLLLSSQTSGKKLWGSPRFSGGCASIHKRLLLGNNLQQKSHVTNLCSQMMLQLHNVYDLNKLNIKVKIVSESPCGTVAAESKRVHASWVVLDRQLKCEEKPCTEELQCNVVVIKRSQPKVLRLNLIGSAEAETQQNYPLPPEFDKYSSKKVDNIKYPYRDSVPGPNVTPTSIPEFKIPFAATEPGTSSNSSSDHGTSPFFVLQRNAKVKNEEYITIKERRNSDATRSDSNRGSSSSRVSSKQIEELPHRLKTKFSKLDRNYKPDENVRNTISKPRNAPLGPPPLCSICQHKAPIFGNPPKLFTYSELELATAGFSKVNFLAEGGFGSVHRGVLPDGQAIAVKQHKLASSQGDHEFCAEVDVLSCAQHRNVVMLIGFCVEERRRLLVYEYICNGSLDSHLYGRNREPLEWSARQKIAVGAARGLRYLHEECRVGCIVHRDMRPKNILITHDFEPLVGDFGLARWQPNGDLGVETRVIGTFGYLAPEYAQSGQITEKADVYSFGVVLMELVTGRKAVDIYRPKGQQCLTEWARPLLEEFAIDELIDPRLGNLFSEQEVLRILEGDTLMTSNHISAPGYDIRNWSGRYNFRKVSQSFDAKYPRTNDLRTAWERERESKSRSFRR